MAKDKGDRFSYTHVGAILVQDNRTDSIAEIYLDGNEYKYRNFETQSNLTEKRQSSIGKEMVKWYVFTIVKAGKNDTELKELAKRIDEIAPTIEKEAQQFAAQLLKNNVGNTNK